MTETERAQDYARRVADAMLLLRGWRRDAPREVVDDVFAEMAKADRFYTGCYARGLSPDVKAHGVSVRPGGGGDLLQQGRDGSARPDRELHRLSHSVPPA